MCAVTFFAYILLYGTPPGIYLFYLLFSNTTI